jgi:hypothetical protein
VPSYGDQEAALSTPNSSKTSLVITPEELALANPAGFPTAATALQPTHVLTRANIQTNNHFFFFFTAAVQGNITVAFGPIR